MLFNSYAFLFVFAPIVYGLYWAARTQDARKWISLVASYCFYAVWSPKFALLMLVTTSVDFFTARLIDDATSEKPRRAWLAVSMVVNLGVLAVFKYYDFFAGAINDALPQPFLPLLRVALPIGISFYTFESMSYTIDVYRRKIRALRRFHDYGHFVTMFPRLIAGPIVRYADLEEQLRTMRRSLDAADVLEAVTFFTLGFAKKVLIADVLAARLVDPLFAQASVLTMTQGWSAALGYTAQLYFDFSGYSDMAVGLGLLLGLRLPRNFNLPYQSANIGEFWRRWHISLSTWLRDYLYIPLGGNRTGHLRNLFLTMLLGGLWHGANWTFVVWGAYHGIALIAHSRGIVRAPWMNRPLSIATTFIVVVVGWVIFRAANVREAYAVFRAMLGAHGLGARWLLSQGPILALLLVALAVSMTVDSYDVKPPKRRAWAFALALVLVISITRLATPSPFLYFQF